MRFPLSLRSFPGRGPGDDAGQGLLLWLERTLHAGVVSQQCLEFQIPVQDGAGLPCVTCHHENRVAANIAGADSEFEQAHVLSLGKLF